MGEKGTSQEGHLCIFFPWTRTQWRKEAPLFLKDIPTFWNLYTRKTESALCYTNRKTGLVAAGCCRQHGNGESSLFTWPDGQPPDAAGRFWGHVTAPGPAHAGCSHPAM